MADSTFGLKIGLEGEREFKKAIADISREMRVLGSRDEGGGLPVRQERHRR